MPHRTLIREIATAAVIELKLLIVLAALALLGAATKAAHSHKPGQTIRNSIIATGVAWLVGMSIGWFCLDWFPGKVMTAMGAATMASMGGQQLLKAFLDGVENRMNQAGGINPPTPPKIDANGKTKTDA